MKILFITNVFERYLNREPLGLMYLSSVLRKNGHRTSVCGTDLNEIIAEFNAFRPDVIGYSITTGFHKFFLELNKKLKERFNFISIFGGPHATFFPEFINNAGVDIICRGEGEGAILELAAKLDRGERIENIQNLWVKSKDGIRQNPPRRLEEKLEGLPHPDRSLFYYRFKSGCAAKIKSIITIRGCPFDCSYCFNNSFNQLYQGLGKVIRTRLVDDVISEIKEMRDNYTLELVYFVTDNFILDRQWLFEFESKYKKDIAIPFHCLVSAELVDEKIAATLRSAGCVSVMMGIESASDVIRQDILKRRVSRQKMIEAARLLKEHGIRVCSQNMLGIPNGSLDADIETYNLNRELKVDYSVVSIMQPYPKTQVYETAKRAGLFKGDLEAIGDAYYDTSPLDIARKKEVERLQKLFALGVEINLSEKIMRFLIRLPLNRIYVLLYRAWKGYCGKARIFPHTVSFKKLTMDAATYVFGRGVR